MNETNPFTILDEHGDKATTYPIAGSVEVLFENPNMIYTPKQARQLAKALKKAARKAEG